MNRDYFYLFIWYLKLSPDLQKKFNLLTAYSNYKMCHFIRFIQKNVDIIMILDDNMQDIDKSWWSICVIITIHI